jgi:hypothetical protein
VTATQSHTRTPASDDPAGDQLIADTLEALGRGFDVDPYMEARAAGATHTEVMFLTCFVPAVTQYAAARRAGMTHQESTDYQIMAPTVGHYCDLLAARAAGTTHVELCEYIKSCKRTPLPAAYSKCRQSGMSHAQLLAMSADGVRLDYFRLALARGATPSEVQEAISQRCDLFDYGQARSRGHAHTSAVWHTANPNLVIT